jgi:hypothetical protein
MSRRLHITLRDGRAIDVSYAERNGTPYEIAWYLLAPQQIGAHFTEALCREVELACLHDLVERRQSWLLALETRERRSA